MKTYRVNVNGHVYEMTLEVIDKSEIKTEEAPVTPKAQAPAGDAKSITSPMPGTILKAAVQNGQTVKKGDILFILEAMKMENEILAPNDGVVSSVSVSAGQSVEAGALLCALS